MSRAAKSILAFSVYLFVLGAVLITTPNTLLVAFRFAPTNEVFVRIVGMLVFLLGAYYAAAARADAAAAPGAAA